MFTKGQLLLPWKGLSKSPCQQLNPSPNEPLTLGWRGRVGSHLQGTGLSEVVATLEAEVKALKAENARLENDSKAVYNQLRAKDKELDNMGEEVERARAIHMENQVLSFPHGTPSYPLPWWERWMTMVLKAGRELSALPHSILHRISAVLKAHLTRCHSCFKDYAQVHMATRVYLMRV